MALQKDICQYLSIISLIKKLMANSIAIDYFYVMMDYNSQNSKISKIKFCRTNPLLNKQLLLENQETTRLFIYQIFIQIWNMNKVQLQIVMKLNVVMVSMVIPLIIQLNYGAKCQNVMYLSNQSRILLIMLPMQLNQISYYGQVIVVLTMFGDKNKQLKLNK